MVQRAGDWAIVNIAVSGAIFVLVDVE